MATSLFFPPIEPQQEAASQKQNQKDIEAFKTWFGKSKVTKPDGTPLEVYRGIHGPESENPFDQTKLPLPTFTDSPDVAGVYAMSPNDARLFNSESKPRVEKHYLKLENPAILTPFMDEDVVSNKTLREVLPSMHISEFRQLVSSLSWRRDGGWVNSDEAANAKPSHDYYTDFHRLADNQKVVDALKKAGYDGIVGMGTVVPGREELHPGFGEGSSYDNSFKAVAEYRPFSPNQIRSAIGNNGDISME